MTSVASPLESVRRSGPGDERHLRDYWHPVVTTGELTGGPVAATLLDEPIVVADLDGRIAALRDVCLHCATPLSLGSATEHGLRCAYDGWTYDADGTIASPASLGGADARALSYAVREAYGLIWVCLGEARAPIPPWPDDAYGDEGFHAFLIGSQTWNTSAGRACENSADMSHLNFVHAGYLELPGGPVIEPHQVRRDGDLLAYDYHDGPVVWQFQIYLPFTLYFKKYAEEDVLQPDDWLMRSAPPGGVTYYAVFASPISATTTRLFGVSLRNHSLDTPDDEWGGEMFRLLLEQDRPVVESQRPERIPTDLREELHLKVADAFALKYRVCLAEIADSVAFLP